MSHRKYRNPRLEYIRSPQPISTRELSQKLGLSYSHISKLCWSENWVEDRKEYWKKTEAKTAEREIEAIADMNVRHLREYKLVQGRAIETLKDKPIKNPRDAVYALDVGIKGERTIRGEPTENIVGEVIIRVIRPRSGLEGGKLGDEKS